MEFDESKHPREPKGSPEGGQFVSKIGFNSTTKQEQALYYREINKTERGEYSSEVFSISTKMRAIAVETSQRSVLFLDNNKNSRSLKCLSVFVFANYDDMIDRLNILRSLEVKNGK